MFHKSADARRIPRFRGRVRGAGSWTTHPKKENAERAAGKLRAKGYTVHSEPVKTSKGVVTRVWLGPFSSRSKADKIKSSVKRSTGMSGIIKTYNN